MAGARESALLAALALGCATGPNSDNAGAGPSGDPSTDPTLMTGAMCGTTIVPPHYVPPNLLVVLDRSCSKLDVIDGQTKWALAIDALIDVTKTFAGRMRFGLTMFPAAGENSCTAEGTLLVPVSTNAQSGIPQILAASLNPNDPNHPALPPCISDISTALIGASNDPALSNSAEKSFLLLVTDGVEGGCQPVSQVKAEATIKTLSANGIRTLVAGFGRDVNAQALSSFAIAGGAPASGLPFYDIADRRSLALALGKIAAPAQTCTFPLNAVPRDAGQLYVFVDSILQPHDPSHVSGSDYDASTNSITVYGQACTQVKAGAVKRVDAVYGCPSP